ncbi:hypothetical protein L6452_01516 [Arctium lappa]|uniref:Uncharacterized protein n=1 Tax=Arctium lappa TaxID=4217 RepID=A0ACB9FGW3_ARCLA|nr:hypothetical protein L6452_01516 [Arctium lappa]
MILHHLTSWNLEPQNLHLHLPHQVHRLGARIEVLDGVFSEVSSSSRARVLLSFRSTLRGLSPGGAIMAWSSHWMGVLDLRQVGQCLGGISPWAVPWSGILVNISLRSVPVGGSVLAVLQEVEP